MNKKYLILGLVMSFLVTGCSTMNSIGQDKAKEISKDFISTVLAPGSDIEIKSMKQELSGDFQLIVNANGQEITSYLSPDGKTFYPQGLNIAELKEKAKENPVAKNPSQDKTEKTEEVVKKEKPEVELFVMSHCPFGTQIEKGMLPVLDTLGDKIDFNLKFVNYAMHGEKEVKEQLNQYCVNQTAPEKFNDYLRCFLEEGKGEECLEKNEITKEGLADCIEKTDKEFSVMAKLEDKDSWLNGRFPKFLIDDEANKKYGVKGSPTLVINGKVVSAGRDAKSLLKAVCDRFDNAPAECDTELSNTPPGAGFGWSTTGNRVAAGCES